MVEAMKSRSLSYYIVHVNSLSNELVLLRCRTFIERQQQVLVWLRLSYDIHNVVAFIAMLSSLLHMFPQIVSKLCLLCVAFSSNSDRTDRLCPFETWSLNRWIVELLSWLRRGCKLSCFLNSTKLFVGTRKDKEWTMMVVAWFAGRSVGDNRKEAISSFFSNFANKGQHKGGRFW